MPLHFAIPRVGPPSGYKSARAWTPLLPGHSSWLRAWAGSLFSLPLPWGPGSLPAISPSCCSRLKLSRTSDSSSDSGGVYFCSHVLLPDGLEITAVTSGLVLGRENGDPVRACVCVCAHVPAGAGEPLRHRAGEGFSPILSPLTSSNPLKSTPAPGPQEGAWAE